MLLASTIESVFHPIQDEIQDHRDRSLENSIPRGLDARENYQCNRSFFRGSKNQSLENGLYNPVMHLVHRWLEIERSKGKQSGFNMLEHYVAVASTRYL